MKKYFILTVLSLVLGFLMARLIFIEYKSDKVIALADYGDKYYFLQLGVYSSYDNMLDNTTKLGNYIYMKEDENYYVFTCITKDVNNTNKIESYFQSLGYETYIKEFTLTDDELSSSIDAVDTVMSNTNEGMKELCKQSLSKYKEG
ncbi:MAG: hypothetical protein IJ565_02790 [Bacilli bacterium]|nr:hypothetical protein [Bacilli bacterium]